MSNFWTISTPHLKLRRIRSRSNWIIVQLGCPLSRHNELRFRLNALDAHDRELVALATAKNNIESFIYDTRDKLEHDVNYQKALTEEDKTKILDQLTETDNWLWDDGITADVKTLKSKLDELKKSTKSLLVRIRESELRPQKVKELKEALNTTEAFVQTSRLLFIKKDDEEKPITEAEIDSLEKIMQETTVGSH